MWCFCGNRCQSHIKGNKPLVKQKELTRTQAAFTPCQDRVNLTTAMSHRWCVDQSHAPHKPHFTDTILIGTTVLQECSPVKNELWNVQVSAIPSVLVLSLVIHLPSIKLSCTSLFQNLFSPSWKRNSKRLINFHFDSVLQCFRLQCLFCYCHWVFFCINNTWDLGGFH